MYKFYASQDKKNDYVAYGIEYLHSVMSFKELVRWAYQQNITPNFISPDDMVTVYKNLVRETQDDKETDETVDPHLKNSGMIDYEAFKKAIVRISVMAQEKLDPTGTSANEDLLKKKLQQDQKENEQKKETRDKMLNQLSEKDKRKKQELDKLREQFEEEQKYKQSTTSKKESKNKKPKEEETNLTLAQQKRKEDE